MPSQANFLEVTDWLCMEGVRLLTNGLEVAPCFNTDFTDNLDKEFPTGPTFRVPLPNLGKIRTSLAYSPTPIQDRHTSVTCDQVSGWDTEWDSIELALSMPKTEARLKKKILIPAMKQIRQDIDSRCALYAYRNTPNVIGTLGINPLTFDAIYGAADQRLTELGGNTDGGKTMLLSPGAARALRASAVAQFNPTNELARMFKTGYIGDVTGFGETYQSMSLYSHTAGSLTATPSVTTTLTDGATSVVITCTNGDTLNEGDVLTFAACNDVNPMTLRSTGTLKNVVVTSPGTTTAAASSMTVSFKPALVAPGSPYQNCDALPLAAATVVLFPGTTSPNGKVGTQGLALCKDAFALVGVKLQGPKQGSVEIVSQAQDPETGISVRFIRMFDGVASKWINRFDSFYGFGDLHFDHASVRVVGA